MRVALFCCVLLMLALEAAAHEVRPALLTVAEVSSDRYLVRWKVPAKGDRRLAIEPVFAARCVEEGDRVEAFAAGASVMSWYVDCPGGLAETEIGFSNLPRTMTDVLVQMTFLDGRYYTGLVRPSNPVFRVPKRDSEASVFGSYLVLGIEHILFGWDHLMFVLGLVLVVTDGRRLIWAITGFTVAHSLTLALAMLDVVRVPGPPVEAVVALSIVLLAVEALRYRRSGVDTFAIRAPWAVSMVIGLVHGLGFARALSEYGLPAYAKLVSLFAFNLGVEVGQLAFVVSLVLLGAAARRVALPAVPRMRFAAACFVGVLGAFWLVERVTGFFY